MWLYWNLVETLQWICYTLLRQSRYQKDLERIRQFRHMNDTFMTVCLADNFEGVELILRIVLVLHPVSF